MEVEKKMMISRLMTRPVIRINEDATIQEAAEVMGREHIGTLLVTRGEIEVGIMTSGDIISKVLAEKHNINTTRVKEIMSTPLVTVEQHTTGEDALRTMVENGVGRLLVADKGEIVGIFTTSDVTKLVP